jgi:hypothetical protein
METMVEMTAERTMDRTMKKTMKGTKIDGQVGVRLSQPFALVA